MWCTLTSKSKETSIRNSFKSCEIKRLLFSFKFYYIGVQRCEPLQKRFRAFYDIDTTNNKYKVITYITIIYENTAETTQISRFRQMTHSWVHPGQTLAFCWGSVRNTSAIGLCYLTGVSQPGSRGPIHQNLWVGWPSSRKRPNQKQKQRRHNYFFSFFNQEFIQVTSEVCEITEKSLRQAYLLVTNLGMSFKTSCWVIAKCI